MATVALVMDMSAERVGTKQNTLLLMATKR
jgi:hypothetical protein